MRSVLLIFFVRFQQHGSIDYTGKFYANLKLFVRGDAAPLYETKLKTPGAADIFLGLNEAGMTVLHCYRLFLQMFR